MEQWIEEFLFRGRPASGPGSEVEPTFSVTVGFRMTHPVSGELMPPSFQQVTPEKAQAMGLALTDLVANINAASIQETIVARQERDKAREERDSAKGDAENAAKAATQLRTQNESLLAELQMKIDELAQANTILDQARAELALFSGKSA